MAGGPADGLMLDVPMQVTHVWLRVPDRMFRPGATLKAEAIEAHCWGLAWLACGLTRVMVPKDLVVPGASEFLLLKGNRGAPVHEYVRGDVGWRHVRRLDRVGRA